jgi:hypothetical protein
VFYTGVKETDLFTETMVLEFLRSPERVLLVIRQHDLDRVTPDIHAEVLGSVTYLDPADVRLHTLLRPNPSEDLSTVLLVANR